MTLENILETVDGFVIGKHPTMAKFMKGVFSLTSRA